MVLPAVTLPPVLTASSPPLRPNSPLHLSLAGLRPARWRPEPVAAPSPGPDRWWLCFQAPTCIHPFTCPFGTYVRGQSHHPLSCSYSTDARGQSHYPLACSYSTSPSPPRSAAFPLAAKVRRPSRHCSRRSQSPPRSAAFPVTVAAAPRRRQGSPRSLSPPRSAVALCHSRCSASLRLSLHSKNDLRILQAGGGRKGSSTSSGRCGGSQ